MYKYKYNMMVTALVVVSMTIIIGIWIIYNHKSEQLEKAMYLLK